MTSFEKIEIDRTYETCAYEISETIFTERDLLLGVLWEGDLEIHSNAVLMRTTPFGERIVHGDSVTAKAINQIFNSPLFSEAKALELNSAKYKFLSPVYIGDQLQVKFIVRGKEIREEKSSVRCNLEYCVFRNDVDKPVSEGITIFTALV